MYYNLYTMNQVDHISDYAHLDYLWVFNLNMKMLGRRCKR